jgi:5-formyltetrahydrofolate cyclo-ligase
MSEGGEELDALKATLRHAMRNQLRTQTEDDRTMRSLRIASRIVELPAWTKARTVMLFSPLSSEPQIGALRTTAEQSGKTTMIIPSTVRVESDLEMPRQPDLILVPGLAFSPDGHRLGRGGGFFDRFLSGRGSGAYKLGVCFAFQLLDELPTESHDVTVDAVITD